MIYITRTLQIGKGSEQFFFINFVSMGVDVIYFEFGLNQ